LIAGESAFKCYDQISIYITVGIISCKKNTLHAICDFNKRKIMNYRCHGAISIFALSMLLGTHFVSAEDVIIVPTIRQTESRGLGYEHGYTTLELFAFPEPYTDEFIPFVDLLGHHFDNGRWAADIGIGSRYFYSKWNMAFGGNVYYDYRESKHGIFQQIGVGAELLTECFNITINGYIPVDNGFGKDRTRVFDNFIGNYVITQHNRHTSMSGMDAEVEAILYRKGFFEFWGAAGVYYLTDSRNFFSQQQNCTGGEFRLEADFGEYVAIEALCTTDKIFHTRVQGRISLTVPFDVFIPGTWDYCSRECQDCCWLERMYMRQPRRHEIVPINGHCCYTTNY